MALIVGNIAASPIAESAVSVSQADLYHENRGNAAWAALDDEVKEQLLRKATDYIRDKFDGSWSAATMAAPLPPVNMASATSALALIARTTPLNPVITRGKKRVKVGSLEIEYDGEAATAPKFVEIIDRLAPLLTTTTTGGMRRLYRC